MIRVCIVLFALAAPTLEQYSEVDTPNSPCPSVFTYEPPDLVSGRWFGVVNLNTDRTLHSLWLNIELDGKADVLGNWIGDVSTLNNKDFKIESTDIKISPETPLSVRFFVQYNPMYKTPRVVTIRMNGIEICNANNLEPSDINVREEQNPAVSPPKESIDSRIQYQCGRVLLNIPTPLVVKGTPAIEGQWPWQIALYETQAVNNKYICGGTLVSHRHVITAAHCVTRKDSKRLVNKRTLTVYLGKHNLRTSVTGVQIRFVENIIVHPEYNRTAHTRDICILELKEPVTYTDWVQPACLWPEDQIELTNVIGKKGSVVGWGYDDNGVVAEALNMVEMPVVDTETCIRSNSEFFVRFTSEYTYCAGARDGSSVCNGDSGGGMVFKNGDSWYLRGLVALSIARRVEQTCDPEHYVIFTDIAKFLPWVKQIVTDF